MELLTLIIDPEFKSLIPKLRKNEYLQLESNIMMDGCREAIITWNGIIVDGHNRYEICHRHQIPFKIQEMDFDCREAVMSWICANQLGRRNISEETRKYLIGMQYQTEKVAVSKRNARGVNQYTLEDNHENLSQAHIEKAAENFDLYQINPVKVSRRDGINYVFNGQHTIEIVAKVSGSRETPVWCMIYDDLSYSHEADIFANQMKFVKALQPYEVFMANIEANNQDQLMIRDLVESYGLTISSKRAPGCICAVSSLESIYSKYGIHVLSRVLRLIIGTWEGDINSFSANILNAIAKLCVIYKNNLDDEVFKEKCGAKSIKALTRIAKDRRPGSMGFAEALILEYNGKKKNSAYRLNIRLLYERDVSLWVESDDDPYDDSDEFENLFDGSNNE